MRTVRTATLSLLQSLSARTELMVELELYFPCKSIGRYEEWSWAERWVYTYFGEL